MTEFSLAPERDKNEMSTATPKMLYDQIGSEQSNMAAAKPEVSISQLVDMMGTGYEHNYYGFIYVFEIQLFSVNIKIVVRPIRKC